MTRQIANGDSMNMQPEKLNEENVSGPEVAYREPEIDSVNNPNHFGFFLGEKIGELHLHLNLE